MFIFSSRNYFANQLNRHSVRNFYDSAINRKELQLLNQRNTLKIKIKIKLLLNFGTLHIDLIL
jgi:ABC-type enterochelin transport system ATPase subunit